MLAHVLSFESALEKVKIFYGYIEQGQFIGESLCLHIRIPGPLNKTLVLPEWTWRSLGKSRVNIDNFES